MSAGHEELHRLADAVPDERVPAAAALLRQLAHADRPRREFSSTGTLSAEPDFAERSEDILRHELGEQDGTA
jgi:hypothetical protein